METITNVVRNVIGAIARKFRTFSQRSPHAWLFIITVMVLILTISGILIARMVFITLGISYKDGSGGKVLGSWLVIGLFGLNELTFQNRLHGIIYLNAIVFGGLQLAMFNGQQLFTSIFVGTFIYLINLCQTVLDMATGRFELAWKIFLTGWVFHWVVLCSVTTTKIEAPFLALILGFILWKLAVLVLICKEFIISQNHFYSLTHGPPVVRITISMYATIVSINYLFFIWGLGYLAK